MIRVGGGGGGRGIVTGASAVGQAVGVWVLIIRIIANMLFGRRERLMKLEEAEAEGRSFWTNKLDETARHRIFYAVEALLDSHNDRYRSAYNDDYRSEYIRYVRRETCEDLGLPNLGGINHKEWEDAWEDVSKAILESDEVIVLSFIEALLRTVENTSIRPHGIVLKADQVLKGRLPTFVDKVKTVLREHRISFDLIEGQFVSVESRVMHEAVIVPTLTLLGSRKDFADVEKAYRDALDQLHTGSPENAITDAGTALQEALSSLHCTGNSLGPLAKDAQNKGLLMHYDRKLIDWVSADRSSKGDAHNAQPASPEDAWLCVHVVGALILRLVNGIPRADQQSTVGIGQ